MKIGCLINLALYAALVAGYYHWLEPTVESPAIWIASCIFGLLTLMALGAIYNSLLTLKDRRAIEEARAGLPPQHGHWSAVAGRIEAVGQPFLAPFTETECVICEYEISREVTVRRTGKNAGTEIRREVDFSGIHMVPCVVRSGHLRVKLLGMPNLDHLPAQSLRSHKFMRQAKRYVQNTSWEDAGGMNAFKSFGGMWRALTEPGEEFRHDWRSISPQECPWVSVTNSDALPSGEESSRTSSSAERRQERNEIDSEEHEADEEPYESAYDQEALDQDEERDEAEEGDDEEEFSTFGPDDDPDDDMLPPLDGLYEPNIQEKRIDVGDEVVVIGPYDAMQGALVTSAKRNGQMLRIYRDSLPAVARKVAGSTYRLLIGGVVGLIVIHGALYLGHWAYCSNGETQREWKNELFAAVKAGDQALAAKFLDRGVDVDSPDDSGEILFMQATDPAMIKFLVDRGADINAQDEKGFTALMYAAHRDRPVELKALIDAGANLDLRNTEYGSTALILAIGSERDECIAILRAAGAKDDTVTAANGQPVLSADPPFVTCQQYLRAVHAHDAEQVKALSTFSGNFDYSGVDWDIWSGGRPASPRLVEGFVNGDDATVKVNGITPKAFHATWVYQLKRVDGEWKVARERWVTKGL